MEEMTRREELLEQKEIAEQKLEEASVQWKSRRQEQLDEIIAEINELDAEAQILKELEAEEAPKVDFEEVDENESDEELENIAEENKGIVPKEVSDFLGIKEEELHLNSESGVVSEELDKELKEIQEKLEKEAMGEKVEPKPEVKPEKIQINQMTTDREVLKPVAPVKKNTKKYICVMQTPKGMKVPFNFKKGVVKMARCGTVLDLTPEEYACHKEFFAPVKK